MHADSHAQARTTVPMPLVCYSRCRPSPTNPLGPKPHEPTSHKDKLTVVVHQELKRGIPADLQLTSLALQTVPNFWKSVE